MIIQDVKVPGATLHVYTQGSGPGLLVIPGAPAADYTVSIVELRDAAGLRYQDRGGGRGELRGPAAEPGGAEDRRGARAGAGRLSR